MPLYVTWLCGQRRHVALKVRPRVLGVEEQQVRALDNLRGSRGGADALWFLGSRNAGSDPESGHDGKAGRRGRPWHWAKATGARRMSVAPNQSLISSMSWHVVDHQDTWKLGAVRLLRPRLSCDFPF